MQNEEKLRIIDRAIDLVLKGDFWMCPALSRGLYEEKKYVISDGYSELSKIFPKFTQKRYMLYHLCHLRFTPLSHLKDEKRLWDESREKKRRIQFLEYLKKTI